MSAPQPLAVGMYVTAAGGVTGRIVDRQIKDGDIRWVIKTSKGDIYWARSTKLTPR